MRKAILLTLLTFLVSIAIHADDRHQSYISYDDGGTVVRGDDGREIEAHRNLPVYPGDEIITSRRGRAEIRLSDGNIVGIDRTTALRIQSILDSYEGDSDQTVVELRYGKVAVNRTDIGRDRVRLDTENASYVADYEAIYSVETDSRGRDRAVVFSGYVEVRTRNRATRLRAGESAEIDSRGVYDLVAGQRHAADDFERWFLDRSDRFSNRSSQYVDRRLSYWADDLDHHGRWVFVTGIGWSWRPYVAVGWRPYRHGYWYHSRGGSLVWVSHDPWGWGPYHYGRWAYDPGFGWVWVPGYGYSPAWVYWWYGSGYVGWAPAGWWDCYRPYYNWAYAPYRTRSIGYGFYGRVRVNEMDLRPWTFVDSGTLVSTRVDRAALTTDAVKQRLGRSPGGMATISGSPARFTREEFRDPAEAIRRRGLEGGMTGRETGAPSADLTPFFRRDNEVDATVRDRIASARGAAPSRGAASGLAPSDGAGGAIQRGNGGLAPIGSGSVAPIGRGSVAPITGGSGSPAPTPAAPSAGDPADRRGGDGRIDRGRAGAVQPPSREGAVDRGSAAGREGAVAPVPRESGDWRSRVGDRERQAAPPDRGAATAPSRGEKEPPNASWRERGRASDAPAAADPAPRGGSSAGSRDVPRRVIDGIGGARVVPRERSGEGSAAPRAREGGETRSSGSREAVRPRSDGGSSSSRSGSSSASSGGSSSGESSGRSSSSSSGSRDSGSNRDSGGRIKRDN